MLNFTLKFPPDPNRSVRDPVLLETGTGAATGLETEGTACEEDPETAEETVWETRGEICATTWETISSEAGAGGGTGRLIGAEGLEAPETAEETV